MKIILQWNIILPWTEQSLFPPNRIVNDLIQGPNNKITRKSHALSRMINLLGFNQMYWIQRERESRKIIPSAWIFFYLAHSVDYVKFIISTLMEYNYNVIFSTTFSHLAHFLVQIASCVATRREPPRCFIRGNLVRRNKCRYRDIENRSGCNWIWFSGKCGALRTDWRGVKLLHAAADSCTMQQ